MVVSAKCAFRFEHKSCMALVLCTPPPAPDFVLMKRGISNIQCRRSSCRCDRDALSELQQREGRFFSPLDRGLRTLLCSNTTPDFPPPLVSLNEEQKRRLWLLSARGWRGSLSTPPPFNHLIRLFCSPRGPGCTRQHSWPLQTNSLTLPQYTHKNIPASKTSPAPSGEAEEGCEPAAIFKRHNNVWQIELHFVNSCQHGSAKRSLDLVLIRSRWRQSRSAYAYKHASLSVQACGDKNTKCRFSHQHLQPLKSFSNLLRV